MVLAGGDVTTVDPPPSTYRVPSPAEVGRAARRHVPALGDAPTVTRLGGGYSWRTYVVASAAHRVVVRVAPAGGTVEPYDPNEERRRIEAGSVAVPTASVLAVEADPAELGAPYAVHSFVPGDVLRLSAVADPAERARYRTTFAATLGDLHARGDAAALDDVPTVHEALRREVERVGDAYRRTVPGAMPGLVVALRWLVTHLPASEDRPVLCHGDFRFGNLSWVSPDEVGGVLDWERAWVGDPACDVAFTRLMSGWCSVAGADTATYERHAGRPVAAERLGFATRLEQVRSLLSSLTGLRALVDGRADDPRLAAIGEAGVAGTWSLVPWLAEGPLAPLPASWRLPAAYRPLVRPGQWSELVGDDAPAGLRAHAAGAVEADAAARAASLAALTHIAHGEGPSVGAVAEPLRRALASARDDGDGDDDSGGDSDGDGAWAAAHELLAAAATRGGAELVPALTALGRRILDRPAHLPAPRPVDLTEDTA